MAAPTFEQLRPRYIKFWREMVCERVSTLDTVAARVLASKARYEKVGRSLGIPWWFIAILHNRESGGNFAGVLHNGEHIIGTGKKTRLVPAGRGPFTSWEQAAIDALKMKGLHNIRDWTVERVCYEGERFNGFGYYFRGVPSAYLWSFSNIYIGGKYVADGVWDPNARDQQVGIMPLLKRMMAKDSTIQFGRFSPGAGAPEAIAAVVVAGGGGAAVVKEANKPSSTWADTIGLFAVLAVGILIAIFIVRKVRNKDKPPAPTAAELTPPPTEGTRS